MKAKEKKLWLDAIQELREHYQEYESDVIPESYGNEHEDECPLCIAARHMRNIVGEVFYSCLYCIWCKYEGGGCLSANDFSAQTTQQRLDRLDRWEEKIKKEKNK